MAEMYMRNISDWREATLMLSFEEKGYYDELLNLIYLYDDLLADDDALICRAMPVHSKTHSRLKRRLLECGLVEIKKGFYFNKRAAQEVVKINELSVKNRVKAHNRWDKSLKNNKDKSTAADAGAMLKVKSESDSESDTFLKNNRKRPNSNEKSKSAKRTNRKTKCTIDQVLNPEGEMPDNYRAYADSQGLKGPDRIFMDWAGWWLGENGRKAGKRGWFATWKARVRKDVDRQLAGDKNRAGRNGAGRCATTEGARLALDRRRNRQRKV